MKNLERNRKNTYRNVYYFCKFALTKYSHTGEEKKASSARAALLSINLRHGANEFFHYTYKQLANSYTQALQPRNNK